jgi:hypothetical protein
MGQHPFGSKIRVSFEKDRIIESEEKKLEAR